MPPILNHDSTTQSDPYYHLAGLSSIYFCTSVLRLASDFPALTKRPTGGWRLYADRLSRLFPESCVTDRLPAHTQARSHRHEYLRGDELPGRVCAGADACPPPFILDVAGDSPLDDQRSSTHFRVADYTGAARHD